MTSVLLILQFILAVVLTITVLLQKSSSIGLGAYSGSNESLFGAKGPAGFLTKLTFVLGLVFVINTLALGYMYNHEKKSTLIDEIDESKIVPSSPKVNTKTLPNGATSKESSAPSAPKDK